MVLTASSQPIRDFSYLPLNQQAQLLQSSLVDSYLPFQDLSSLLLEHQLGVFLPSKALGEINHLNGSLRHVHELHGLDLQVAVAFRSRHCHCPQPLDTLNSSRLL